MVEITREDIDVGLLEACGKGRNIFLSFNEMAHSPAHTCVVKTW